MTCSIIIVTYNSQKHLPKALECLESQTACPHEIIIVDTGSANHDYLYSKKISNIKVVIAEKDSGFCKGNNIGFSHLSTHSQFVFLLNPDAFIEPRYLEDAVAFMQKKEHACYGALTGTTLGYDIVQDKPTGKYDTTGVFNTWYGRWYDRAQGQLHRPNDFKHQEDLPAICGAVFFCRRQALEETLIRGSEILDNRFYMYKEDIDLSQRLKRKGWKLAFVPHLEAYHCRGWNPDRKKMPRRLRLYSARNECLINLRRRSICGAIYSGLKYAAVKFFNL